MRIGIVSDSHGRDATVRVALEELSKREVGTVLHCGDLDEPRTVAWFAGLTAHFVFGNCDDDREAIRSEVEAVGGTLHEPFGRLELAGRRIAFVHGDDSDLLRDLIGSGMYDYVFHGHTHRAVDYRVGPTRVINPGALHRAQPRTFVVLDLATGEAESVVVDVAGG